MCSWLCQGTTRADRVPVAHRRFVDGQYQRTPKKLCGLKENTLQVRRRSLRGSWKFCMLRVVSQAQGRAAGQLAPPRCAVSLMHSSFQPQRIHSICFPTVSRLTAL